MPTAASTTRSTVVATTRPWATVAVAAWLVVLAAFVRIGSDLLWVVALGDRIRTDGQVPDGIPYAVAPTAGWPNPLVLAEVGLSVIHGLGRAALVSLHLALVGGTLVLLVLRARARGGSEGRTAATISLLVLAGLAPFVVARLPSLSILPFVALLLLLTREDAHPTSRIWAAVPLVAVWGNLHGAVLLGVLVLSAYLVGSRIWFRPVESIGVGVAAVLALLGTSAGWRTPEYYLGVLTNEAARAGTDLWAAPSLRNPLDVVMVLALVGLGVVWLCQGTGHRWEQLAVAGLAVGTVLAARNGVWLALVLAALVLSAPRRDGPRRPPTGRGTAALAAMGVLGAALLLGLRGEAVAPPGAQLVPSVLAVAEGRAVLAVEPFAETLAAGGGQVWAANPIDAFDPVVQRELLAFLAGGDPPESADIEVVVMREAMAERLVQGGGWSEHDRSLGLVVLQRD